MDSAALLAVKLVSLLAIIVISLLVARKLSLKINLYIICGYVCVLAALTVICFCIPSSALKTDIGPARNVDFYQSANDLGARLSSGNFDAPEGFTKTETSFDLQTNNITISSSNFLTVLAIKGVDVPDNGDNKINVYSYTPHMRYNNLYYTVPIEPTKFIFSKGVYPTLNINFHEQNQVDFYRFDTTYALPQFIGTDISTVSAQMNAYQIVVVVIPSGISYSTSGTMPISELITSIE